MFTKTARQHRRKNDSQKRLTRRRLRAGLETLEDRRLLTVIAADGFEAGDFSSGSDQWAIGAWQATGDATIRTNKNSPHSGNDHVRLRDASGQIQRTVDVTGLTNIQLSYWSKLRSLEGSEQAHVRVSGDGLNWTTLQTFGNGDDLNQYVSQSHDVPAVGNTLHVRFEADMNDQRDYWYIDDVSVEGSASGPVEISISAGSISERGGVDQLIPSGAGGLSQAKSMILHSDNRLYVASSGTDSVLRFDPDTGAYIDTFISPASGGLDNPTGMIFTSNGDLLVSSKNTNQVLRFDGTSGNFLGVQVAASLGGLNGPGDLLLGTNDSLYVSSYNTQQVLRYDAAGAFVDVFVGDNPGTPSIDESGGILRPVGSTFGRDGNFYLAGFDSDNVLKYDSSGNYLGEFVSSGSNGLDGPADIQFGPDGSFYVTSFYSHQVLRFDGETGAPVDAVIESAHGELLNPRDLVFDNEGNLIVGGKGSDNVVRVNGSATVSLSAASPTEISVDYTLSPGTATAGADFVAHNGTITFAPGETSRKIFVAAVDDSLPEADEYLTATIGNPSGDATLVNISASITIVDDDAPVGLVSHWTAENTGDDDQNRNHGTIVDGTDFVTGQVGQAFSFDGIDDRVVIADSPSLALTKSMTIEGWVRVDSFPTNGHGLILFRGDDRGGLDPYQLTTTTAGKIQFQITSNVEGTSLNLPMPQGEFVHVAATLDDASGDMSLYLNGVRMAHKSTTIRPFESLDSAHNPGIGIGNHGGAPQSPHNFPFHGLIDDLKVYDLARSDAEILASYNDGKGTLLPSISIGDATVIEGASGGELSSDFLTPQSGGLNDPRGIAFGPDGDLFVASSDPARILRYDSNTGAFEGVFADASDGGIVDRTGDLEFRGGYLYVTTAQNSGVMRFDASSGLPASATGKPGATFVSGGDGGLQNSYGMAFGPDGNLYLTNQISNNVLRYHGTTGDFMDVFVPAASGGLNQPNDLIFDSDGNLLVASSGTDEILLYDGPLTSTPGQSQGAFVSTQSGGLNFPPGAGMVFGADGNLYVSSRDSDQVLVFSGVDGTFIESVRLAGTAALDGPKGLAFDGANRLYVASSNTRQVLRTAPVTDVKLVIGLSAPSPTVVSVDFATADGTASLGSDYVGASGTINFPPGVVSQTIHVATLDDAIYEGNESFAVNLTNPDGATLSDSQGFGTIIDNETPPPNQPPIAGGDSYSVSQDGNLVSQAPGVLANDSDADGDLLTAALANGPSNGVLSLALDGSFTYTPSAGFVGEDSFTYTVSDLSGGSDSATVTISVNSINSGPDLAHGIVNVGSTWQTVTLADSYSSMVVIATPNYDLGSTPAVTRVRNASGNSFEIRVDAAGPTSVGNMDVHYIVLEEGVYDEAGYKLEAVKYESSETDENNSWVGQSRSYQQSYQSPVVVGQVMSYNDPLWSVFWAAGSSRTSPPTSTALTVGKHVGEDATVSRANETIGYLVIETNVSGTAEIEGLPYVAAVGGDTVKGIDDAPGYSYTYSAMPNSKTAVASQAGMDGGNGSWAVLYGANPITPTGSTLNLAVDEDQSSDSERKHTTEQVAYFIIDPPVDRTVESPTPQSDVALRQLGHVTQWNNLRHDDPILETVKTEVLGNVSFETINQASSSVADALRGTDRTRVGQRPAEDLRRHQEQRNDAVDQAIEDYDWDWLDGGCR